MARIDWARFGYTPGPRSGSRSSFTDKYEHLCSCLLHICSKIMLNLPSKGKAKFRKKFTFSVMSKPSQYQNPIDLHL